MDQVQRSAIPGVGMMLIDGIVRCGRSRNTPPAKPVPVTVPDTINKVAAATIF